MPQHEAIFGMTRSGKSYKAQAIALRWPGPVLFINPQDQDMDLGEWTRTTPHDSLDALVHLLATDKRARIVFVPSVHPDQCARQLLLIVRNLMKRRWRLPLLIVFDEFDIYAPQGKKGTAAHEVAQRGGKQGIWGLFVTQHASVVDKMIVRQCPKKLIFLLEDSAEYLNHHSMPGERIEQILSGAPKYSYVTWERRQLLGPFKDAN